MISRIQLENLKPIQDQVNRMNQVRSKRKIRVRKGRLTKRARQWAEYIPVKDIKYPKGEKSFGNLPMKEKRK